MAADPVTAVWGLYRTLESSDPCRPQVTPGVASWLGKGDFQAAPVDFGKPPGTGLTLWECRRLGERLYVLVTGCPGLTLRELGERTMH
jgi:hypothetical protein